MPISSYKSVYSIAPGARVALIAPAGALKDETDLERAVANAESLGWDTIAGANALKRFAYFAGGDAERLQDLNRAIADSTVDAVWCIRGGYGAMRLLDGIDYDSFIRKPKPLIGFSDITALLCALGDRSKTITYHGPTARGNLTQFSQKSLVHATVELTDSCGVAEGGEIIREGNAGGRLAGGNLAILAALCGTLYQPRFADSIVVLEDINEPVYRVDRLLQQLLLSGAMDGCKAVIFGTCSNCGEPDSGRGINDILKEVADHLKIPCISGVPVGHIDDQWTLPMGALAQVDTSSRTLTVIR